MGMTINFEAKKLVVNSGVLLGVLCTGAMGLYALMRLFMMLGNVAFP